MFKIDSDGVLLAGGDISVGSAEISDMVWNDTSAAVTLDIDGESVNLSEFIKGVKEALGQSPVLLKCSHCGQWGAKFCACRYCGAPIG